MILNLRWWWEVSSEPLGSSGCRRRCRCCGSLWQLKWHSKPKSKHKGLVPTQKTKLAVKISDWRNFRCLGAVLLVRAKLLILPGGTSGLNRYAGCSSIWAEIWSKNHRIRGNFGTKSCGKVGELQINTKDKFLSEQNHTQQIARSNQGQFGAIFWDF